MCAVIVKACVDSALQLGLPEARIPLAQAVVTMATAPKSNSSYMAINRAMADIRAGKVGDFPRCLQNKHFDGAEVENKGQFYQYPHDYPNHYVEQQYLPDVLVGAPSIISLEKTKMRMPPENTVKSCWQMSLPESRQTKPNHITKSRPCFRSAFVFINALFVTLCSFLPLGFCGNFLPGVLLPVSQAPTVFLERGGFLLLDSGRVRVLERRRFLLLDSGGFLLRFVRRLFFYPKLPQLVFTTLFPDLQMGVILKSNI